MNNTKELRFAELVINPCSRVYGSSPCTASVGVTGDFKCYNSPNTCQDPSNYLAGDEQVIRWAIATSDLPIEVEAMPCISNISRRPQVIDPGEGLGVRESVTVSMTNFRHNDAGFDPYLSERGYNTYNKGTYWGKFSARWGSLEGYEFRTVDGYEGQNINDMTRRYYIVDSTDGPDANGRFSFTAKDIVKFMDSDKAQWPLPSSGVLASAIITTDTSLTLSPTGIGDIEYPASGVASIADEKMTFTRVGDVVTLTGRALSGSKLDDHDEGATFQIAAVYSGLSPAEIIRDLLEDATDVPAEYIDFSTWETEVTDFLGRLYSAEVMQPTPVKTLIEELVREAGLTLYTNLENKKIVVKVLRQEVPTQYINDDIILAGSISSKKQESKRVSDVWVYYGKKNPLEKQSEQKNYAAIYAKITENPQVALNNNPSAIREMTSRWISIVNGDAAFSIADRLIARYEKIPRRIALKIPNYYNVSLGNQITLQSRIFENSQGDQEDAINCQVVSIENESGIYTALAEELIFGQVEPHNPNLRIISINADVFNLNLRTAHDLIYTPISTGQTVRLLVGNGVNIGGSISESISLDIGSWPSGVIIEIGGAGRIQGMGGAGGISSGFGSDGDGMDGGTAIYTRHDITIISDIEIYGGGGGGGGGWTYEGPVPYGVQGGGGAGFITAADRGGIEYGGVGEIINDPNAFTGDGGGIGEDGQNGSGEDAIHGQFDTFGGAAGAAIDGISYVTITASPDIIGPQVN